MIPANVEAGEDIVTFKVIFNRADDWRDIERLYDQSTTRIDLDYVIGWLSTILGADDSRSARLQRVAAGERPSEPIRHKSVE